MIIGISGSQGQGKSTLIKAATENNRRFSAHDVQTSRNLLKRWDITLGEVNAYMPLKIKFQDQLIEDHIRTLRLINQSSGIHLVERTFADIFTYAVLSVGPFNEYSEWLSDYYNQCKEAKLEYFDRVIYLNGRVYTPESDGVRSTNPHFANLADMCIYRYSKEFSARVVTISNPHLTARVNVLNESLRELGDGLWHQG